MELFFEILKYAAITIISIGVGWFFSKLQTKREQKKSDFELISDAINNATTPLLKSFSELNNHYTEVVDKLIKEQVRTRELLRENAALIKKVDQLEQKVVELTVEVKKIRNEKNTDNTGY
jgi:predicted nuclease with TOPRIM domain